MTDRMGEFTSSLNRLSKPNSTAKPQVKPTKSSRGGGSSAQGLGSSSGTRGYQVGGSPGYGISGIKLADSYDLYDIILSHLLDEGYAETSEAAEAIMVNMSEEWRDNVFELTQSELDVEAKKVNQNTRNAPIQRQQPPSKPDGTPQRPIGAPIPGTGMIFKKATDVVRAGVSSVVNR
jgi:hypothetical protein